MKLSELKNIVQELLNEMDGVGEQYATPRAFKKKNINEISYREYKKSTEATPKQKIGNSVKLIHKKINEIKKLVKYNVRLKEEMGVNEEYGKTVSRSMTKIAEELNHLSNQFRNLSN